MLVHVHYDELLRQLAVRSWLCESLGHAGWLVDSGVFAEANFTEMELVHQGEFTWFKVNVVHHAKLLDFRRWDLPGSRRCCDFILIVLDDT